MEDALLEKLPLLQYIFAGLVMSWIFYGLVPHKKPDQFERIVQALVYTAMIGLLATPINDLLPEKIPDNIVIFSLAVFLGILFAICANNNIPHRWVTKKWPWITSQSTWASSFEEAFQSRRKRFIVLLLKDGRRIYGWPRYWPNYPGEDCFILTEYRWLPGEGDKSNHDTISICRNDILIDYKYVHMIEFITQD